MNLALRIGVSLLLLAAAWRVTGQRAGVLATANEESPTTLDEAVQADPTSAENHLRLGVARRDSLSTQDLELAEFHLSRACELNPFNWRCHLELARGRELAGRIEAAEESYLEALRLNPHSASYRWQAANFYLRSGQPEKAARALGAAVAADPKFASPAFDILVRMDGGFSQIDEVWPTDLASRGELLFLGIRRGTDPGAEPPLDFLFGQWRRLAGSGEPIALSRGFRLVEHLLRRGEAKRAKRLWTEANDLLGVRDENYSAGTNMVWNGDFELPMSKGALDWRIAPSEDFSARYAIDEAGGAQSLRVDFHGRENLDFVGVTQALVVEPGASLRLSCRLRGDELTTDQGPLLQVLDQKYRPLLATPPVLGSTEWASYEGAFTVPDDHGVIHLRIRRRPSSRIDNRLSGSLWLDSVRISPFAVPAKGSSTAAE